MSKYRHKYNKNNKLSLDLCIKHVRDRNIQPTYDCKTLFTRLKISQILAVQPNNKLILSC